MVSFSPYITCMHEYINRGVFFAGNFPCFSKRLQKKNLHSRIASVGKEHSAAAASAPPNVDHLQQYTTLWNACSITYTQGGMSNHRFNSPSLAPIELQALFQFHFPPQVPPSRTRSSLLCNIFYPRNHTSPPFGLKQLLYNNSISY